MHLYVRFKFDNQSKPIPIHYNHLIQSAIYSLLPSNMATFLHDNGYEIGKRKFKLFSFSSFLGKYQINRKEGTITFINNASLVFASPNKKFIATLANSLLTANSIRIGDSHLPVESVIFEEQIVGGNTVFVRTLSPVVAYSTLFKPEGGKYTVYYQPGEKEFNNHISNNLRKKYLAFWDREAPEGDIQIRALDRPRLHIIYFKDTLIKGYSCRLRLKGPQDLLQMALDASIGAKSSNGFGLLQLLKKQ